MEQRAVNQELANTIAKIRQLSSGRAVAPNDGHEPSNEIDSQLDILAQYHQSLLEDYDIQGKILEVTSRILNSGSARSTLEDTFRTVITICQDAIRADTSVIEIYDKEKEHLVGVATDVGPYKPEGYFVLPITESALSCMAFLQGEVVAIDDVKTDPRVSQRIRSQFNAASGIAAPLKRGNEIIGVILTMTQERKIHFTERDKSLMEGLAHVISLALHTHFMHKKRVEAEFRLQRLVEFAPEAILLLDNDMKILEANATAELLFGKSAETIIESNLRETINDETQFRVVTDKLNKVDYTLSTHFEATILDVNAKEIPVEISANKLAVADKTVYQLFIKDITQRRAAENELFEEKERAETTLRSIGDAVITTNQRGHIESVNPAAAELTGWAIESALGIPLEKVAPLISDGSGKPVKNVAMRCINENKVIEINEFISLKDRVGAHKPVELSASPLKNNKWEVVGAVIVLRDVGEARKMAQEMSYIASHDSLTGLDNRAEFERRLRGEVRNAKEGHARHSLCFVDLDKFKVVNDTCGHLAGDELLKQLTKLMKSLVRETDVVGRLGGDEFGLLLVKCPLSVGAGIAEKIRDAVKKFRFVWEGKILDVGVSIGITEISSESGELTQIINEADSACYIAKDRGRNSVVVYTPDNQEIMRKRSEVSWSQKIRMALDDGRFVLYAHSIVPLAATSGKAHQEILLRMIDTDGSLIMPDAFIPAAERYKLMNDIDLWVVNEAFANIEAYKSAHGVDEIMWAINLSGQSIGADGMLEGIVALAKRHGIRAYEICFEITETSAIANLNTAIPFIVELRQLGFQFALDDFGSGLSSLAYLHTLAVDYLKIDGRFIKDIAVNPVSYAMVDAINNIGHVMGLKTIAEFVEDQRIAEILKNIGVDYAQGHGFGAPAPLK